MKTQGLARVAGIGLIGFLALGVIGIAAKGDDSRVWVTDVAQTSEGYYDDGGAFGGDVMGSIDNALGREPSMAPAPMPADSKASAPAGAAGAPPMRDADQSTRSSAANENGALIRPDVPITGPTDPLAMGSTASLADDRKIVQTASMRLQVKEVGASFEEVGRVAASAGGFVASSNFSYQGEVQVASMTIRVPASAYQDVLSQVRGLGAKVEAEGSNASDVTEEYTDLSARLRNLEATETQLLAFLGQARNISEVLQVQDRLNNTRSEIERVKGRMTLLTKLTDLATITVHLRPVVATTNNGGGSAIGNAVEEAWADSLAFLEDVATGALTVIVFAWWVPVIGVPAWVIGGRWLRSRPRPVETQTGGV